MVVLSKCGKTKHFRVNRLVAEAYIPNPEGLPHVGHKNEIRYKNYVSNLYWTEPVENNNHGTRN
jgi:hypothetical protein